MPLGTRPVLHVEQSQGYVWKVATLTWVPEVQAEPGTVNGLTDAQLRATAVPVSGTVTANIGTVATLATAAKQDTGNTSVGSVDTKLTQRLVIPVSGSTSASGNTTLITPGAGAKLRISYLSYNPSAAAEVAFRFGAAGTLILRNNLTTGGSVIAKDFGDFRYIEGATNESLILNLSVAVATIWNVNYVEV